MVAAVKSHSQKEKLLRENYVNVPFILVNIVRDVNNNISGAIPLFAMAQQPPVNKSLLIIEDS